jgi:hypothetical protein
MASNIQATCTVNRGHRGTTVDEFGKSVCNTCGAPLKDYCWFCKDNPAHVGMTQEISGYRKCSVCGGQSVATSQVYYETHQGRLVYTVSPDSDPDRDKSLDSYRELYVDIEP